MDSNTRPRSLRRLLLSLILPVLALSWAITAVVTYRDAHHELDELFDAELAQSAKLLVDLYIPGPRGDGPGQGLGRGWRHFETDRDHEGEKEDHDGEERRHRHWRGRPWPLAHKYEQEIVYEIHAEDGQVLTRSVPDAPDFSKLTKEGYATLEINGATWETFTLSKRPGGWLVTVAQNHRVREELSRKAAASIFLPLLIFIPISGLIVAFGVARGLKPLLRLADEVGKRTKDNLKPFALDSAPLEAKPLVDSLNSLLARIEKTLANERRFTSDAAHELRTPIAGLKAQLEVIRDSTLAQEREQAVGKALIGVDRMTRLTSQLLELARLDQMHELHELSDVRRFDLRPLVADIVSEEAEVALEKKQELSLADTQGFVTGNHFLLGILIRNLVNNAIRYTPAGGTIELTVGATDDQRTYFEVIDSGPGIPEEEIAKIFDRFVRGKGATASGSGLGLSIVRRIAELHGAQVEVKNLGPEGGPGLRVRVVFA